MQDKPFHTLSGPWSGWSIQEGFRLTERLEISISRRTGKCETYRNFAVVEFSAHASTDEVTVVWIEGTGTDVDGEFEIQGLFDPITLEVSLIRRYTRAPKNPSQVGYPFHYEGRWNGYCVYGTWSSPDFADTCGPFEMWPEDQGEVEELSLDELLASGPLPTR